METESNKGSKKELKPKIIRTFEDTRFSVSDVVPLPNTNSVAVVYQDSTTLFRLGKIWNIIEPDELGAFQCWKHGVDTGWQRTKNETWGNKPTCLAYCPLNGTAEKLFVGLDNGYLLCFNASNDDQFKKVDQF